MKKIILITGGQRSGKSEYAEKLALSLSKETLPASIPMYIATAHVWDSEFAHRVELHQIRRGNEWINIECEKELDKVTDKYKIDNRVILIDCVTLWATNFFFDEPDGIKKVESALKKLKTTFDKFTSEDATYIFVTNEIGLGGVSDNNLQRQFTDLQGWINQYIASKADTVFFMVSGIAMCIKDK